MKQLKELFEQYTGKKAVTCDELPQSGSNRRYFRLQAEGISLIGAMGTSVEENNAFICLARHFREAGLNVPEVYVSSPDKVYYLQEDLGTVSLFDAISSGRQKGSYNVKEVALLKKTMALLPKFQFEGGRDLDYSACYPQPEFDERNIWFDFNYFTYSFLKTSGLDSKIKASEQRIARLETQMDRKEAELRSKYGQMEGALNSLEGQQNSISNFTNQQNRNR